MKMKQILGRAVSAAMLTATILQSVSCGDNRTASSQGANASETGLSGAASITKSGDTHSDSSDGESAASQMPGVSGTSSSAASRSSSAAASSVSPNTSSAVDEPIDTLLSSYLLSKKTQTGQLTRIFSSSVLLKGNSARIMQAMKKSIRKEPVVIGAIGGSITAGASAASLSASYSYLVYDWWKKTFPGSDVTYYNYGIGATGSVLGAHRVDDLMSKNPDFVIIDFSVNDFSVNPDAVKECYESLIRRVMAGKNSPGVMLIAFTHKNRINMQELHKTVAEQYELPFISFHDAVWGIIDKDKSDWTKIKMFGDDVHPNTQGHAFAADLMIHQLKAIQSSITAGTQSIPALPDAMTKVRSIDGKMLDNSQITPKSGAGWKVNNSAYPVAVLQKGWSITGSGSYLEFQVNSKALYLYYNADASSANIKITVNGNPAVLPAKDGSQLAWAQIYAANTRETRTVRIEVISAGTFTLYPLLVSGNS